MASTNPFHPFETIPLFANHFPVVEGLTILAQRFNSNPTYEPLVKRLSSFLVSSFDPDTGLFDNAWGDIPGKPTGVVHQAAAAGALIDAYEAQLLCCCIRMVSLSNAQVKKWTLSHSLRSHNHFVCHPLSLPHSPPTVHHPFPITFSTISVTSRCIK